MMSPRIDELLEKTGSNYATVIIAAKRARQINSYYHSLSEGGYGEYRGPMVPVPSGKNYLSTSLDEIAAGKLKFEYRS